MDFTVIRKLSTCLCATMLAGVAALSTSCNSVIYDDEPICEQGLAIRFVYDYNMENANAFPSQVHCLTVFIYDADGHYVTTLTETDRSKLSDENWRMNIDLPEGSYQVVAYGGMACPDASFSFENATGNLTDRRVELDADLLTSPVGPNLHPLFYGEADVVSSVGYFDDAYVPVTVYMMKDTNNIRILLHNADGSPVSSDDFTFRITDDNTLFNYDNNLRPAPVVTYWPWTQGNIGGISSDDDVIGTVPSFVYAELSTSRLVTSSSARLVIEQQSSGRVVLSIPLVKYLLLYKSDNYGMMGNQEFLDRKSEWELSLFLDSVAGGWGTVTIWIDDWSVRINNIEA